MTPRTSNPQRSLEEILESLEVLLSDLLSTHLAIHAQLRQTLLFIRDKSLEDLLDFLPRAVATVQFLLVTSE